MVIKLKVQTLLLFVQVYFLHPHFVVLANHVLVNECSCDGSRQLSQDTQEEDLGFLDVREEVEDGSGAEFGKTQLESSIKRSHSDEDEGSLVFLLQIHEGLVVEEGQEEAGKKFDDENVVEGVDHVELRNVVSQEHVEEAPDHSSDQLSSEGKEYLVDIFESGHPEGRSDRGVEDALSAHEEGEEEEAENLKGLDCGPEGLGEEENKEKTEENFEDLNHNYNDL